MLIPHGWGYGYCWLSPTDGAMGTAGYPLRMGLWVLLVIPLRMGLWVLLVIPLRMGLWVLLVIPYGWGYGYCWLSPTDGAMGTALPLNNVQDHINMNYFLEHVSIDIFLT